MLRQEASIVDDIGDGAAHDAHTQHQQTVSRRANAPRQSQRLAALLGARAQDRVFAQRNVSRGAIARVPKPIAKTRHDSGRMCPGCLLSGT